MLPSIFERRKMLKKYGVDQKYLVRTVNIDNRFFKNFTLEDLLENFEKCDEVNIKITKVKDELFSIVVVDGVEK